MTGIQLLLKILDERNAKLYYSLKEDMFEDEERKIYKLLKKYSDKYRSLPPVTIVTEALSEDVVIPDTPVEFLFERVLLRKLKIGLLSLSEEIQDAIKQGDIDKVLDSIDAFSKEYRATRSASSDVYKLSELVDMVEEYIDDVRCKSSTTFGITTGWPSLDEVTNGYQGGDIVLIVGRPGRGKSMLMLYKAYEAFKSGKTVLVVSMEMTVLQQARRLLALMAGVKGESVIKGTLCDFGMSRIRNLKSTINGDNFLMVDGRFRTSIDDVEALIHEYKPDCVYIDGGYLIKIQRNYRSKWEVASEIARDLKSVAIAYNIPVIASFQFNRESERTKKKGIEHIHLTDELGQIASIALSIDDSASDIEKYIVTMKVRDGIDTAFPINWDWERMNFSERRLNDEIDWSAETGGGDPDIDSGNGLD